MRTQEWLRPGSIKSSGRRCASWITDQNKDPVHFEVMKRDDREVSMRAFHHGRQYFLYLDLAGHGRHHCNCRDFRPREFISRRVRFVDIFCRHIVAAALQEGRLELLLSLLTKSH